MSAAAAPVAQASSPAVPQRFQPAPLRVLSLWQPWASLMAVGAKKIETRSWSTAYRGWIAIHASKRCTPEIREASMQVPFCTALRTPNIPFGKVVAVGYLVQVLSSIDAAAAIELGDIAAGRHELAFGDYSYGRFGWVFRHIFELPHPIPLRASQGLFHAPADLRAAILAQLPALNLERAFALES